MRRRRELGREGGRGEGRGEGGRERGGREGGGKGGRDFYWIRALCSVLNLYPVCTD